MATSLVLRVLAAPLTHHHLVVQLNSYDGSGFGAFERRVALRSQDDGHDTAVRSQDPDAIVAERRAREQDEVIEQRRQFALDAIARDQTFAAAIEGRRIGPRAISDMSASMQFHALAPRMPICESNAVPEDHPIFDLVGKPLFLSEQYRQTILDAFAEENHVDFTPGQFEDFYTRYYGATFVICAD